MPLGMRRKSKTRKWSFMGKPKEPEPEDDGRVNVRAYNKKVRPPPSSPKGGFQKHHDCC